MKTLLICIVLLFLLTPGSAQSKINVDPGMYLQLRIPIQHDDKSWANWNVMPSPQDSSKILRIDRLSQGYAPFIARHDAPYYSAKQVKEIQTALEKILNPDLYFATQEEFMKFYQEFMGKLVYRKDVQVR